MFNVRGESRMSTVKSVSAAKAETRDGVEIVYDIYGDPSAEKRLVLIHSLAMERGFWERTIERLATKARVLALDCRGHGASGKPKGPYTVGQFADDVAQVMDQAGFKTATVAGCSMGGCVALAFAI